MLLEKPRIVEKPWGREIFLSCNEKYVMEIMEIRKGERTSLHLHKTRMETFYVLKGLLKVNNLVLREGAVVTVPPGEPHRLEALEDTVVVECSTPEVDDIVRLEDDYGRVARKSENHTP